MIELGSVGSLREWANLDLAKLDRRQRAGVIGAALVCLAVAFGISYLVYRRYGAPRNEYDLRIYYAALNFWHAGNDLYSYSQFDPVNGPLGFTYPPVAAILMLPMTTLSIRPVVALTSVGIFASTVGLVLLSLRERVRLRRPQLLFATGLATALAFCLQPISQNAAYGQVNTTLALLVMFDIFVLSRRQSRWAGVGIGLAMAVKLTPAIFLVYLVVSGQWRSLRLAILTAVGGTLVGGLFAPGATWRYFTSLVWDSGRIGVLDNTANQSINGTLARIAAPLAPDKLAWFLGALILVLIGSMRVRRAVDAGDPLLAVSITGLLGVLISPVSWIHHAVWIAPAMLVLISKLVSAYPGACLRRLAKDPSSFARLDLVERRAVRDWLGTALLGVSGMLLWVLNTRNLFGLPDTHYAGLGIWAVLAGSVQTIWMVVAVLSLPTQLTPLPTGPVQSGHRLHFIDRPTTDVGQRTPATVKWPR